MATGSTTHSYPASTCQVLFQPSPSCLLPSSHASSTESLTKPFPQISVQTVGEEASCVVQSQPVSITQAEPQPSPFTALLSSHCSDPSTSPFPHVPDTRPIDMIAIPLTVVWSMRDWIRDSTTTAIFETNTMYDVTHSSIRAWVRTTKNKVKTISSLYSKLVSDHLIFK